MQHPLRRWKSLLEAADGDTAQAGPAFILDLPDEQRATALAAFQSLADGQRLGPPERLGGASLANKGIHVSGLYAGLTEHVGDITHRMAKRYDFYRGSFGNVRDKVELGLRRIDDNDIERQVRRNYEFTSHPERDADGDGSKRFLGSFADWLRFWRDAGNRYADAHAALPVWNEAQWHAREAAVACGRLQLRVAHKHLSALRAHLRDEEDWTRYAGQVTLGADGLPQPFRRAS